MDVNKVKKGKQKLYVNDIVKEHDEECLDGENLFGELLDSIDVCKKPHLIQIGNLREERKKFKNPQDGRVYSAKGCCPTLTLSMPPKILIEDNCEYKVRELSGFESMRLMGVDDDDIQKIVDVGLSNNQLTQLAGNSIVVNIMSSFFKEMVKC
jgi:hypothetical protein